MENKGKKITRSGRWGKKTKITLRKWEAWKNKITLRKWGAKEKNKVTRNKKGMQIDFLFATMGTWR